MKRIKVILFTTLVIPTLTTIFFGFRVFNPPKVLSVVVLGVFREVPESWPTEDITNHPLKGRIMRYVNKSIRAGELWRGYLFGERVYMINDPEVEEFFGKYYVSTWCGTCNSAYLKDAGTSYYFMVNYSNLRVSLSEYVMAWTISIATVILWIFAFLSIQKLKGKKEEMKNV